MHYILCLTFCAWLFGFRWQDFDEEKSAKAKQDDEDEMAKFLQSADLEYVPLATVPLVTVPPLKPLQSVDLE